MLKIGKCNRPTPCVIAGRTLVVGAIELMAILAGCGGSEDLPTLELIGVEEGRAQEAIDVVRSVRECDRPLRVVLNSRDNYSVECEKDGFVFNAVRSHTVFCADGPWQFVAWADFAGTDNSCTPT